MTYIFLETLSSKLEKNTTIKKYNKQLSINILDHLSYVTNIGDFSWSVYCTYISRISNSSSLDIDTLYAIELTGIVARLIDDALDKDTTLFEKVGTEYLFLLSNELIVESLELLNKNSFFDYNLLKTALHAEFKDFTTILSEKKLTIDFYFEEILPKSAAIFQLFTKLASGANEYLNDFAIHYGNYAQILNDVSNFWDNHSADISNLKSSLPLLAGTNTLNLEQNKEIIHLLSKNEDLTIIREKIFATGALNFSQQLMELERNKVVSSLNKLSMSDDLVKFKYYLGME